MLFCLVFLVSLATVGCAPVWSIPGTEKIGQVDNHFVIWLLFPRVNRSRKNLNHEPRRTWPRCLSFVLSLEFVSWASHVTRVCQVSPSRGFETWVCRVSVSRNCAPLVRPAICYATCYAICHATCCAILKPWDVNWWWRDNFILMNTACCLFLQHSVLKKEVLQWSKENKAELSPLFEDDIRTFFTRVGYQ